MARRPGEDVPVSALADMRVEGVAEIARAKRQRMVLVKRLPVNHRFNGREVVILGDPLPAFDGLGETVPGLVHVEIEPGIAMKPGGRGLAAARVEAHQDRVVVLFPGDSDGP